VSVKVQALVGNTPESFEYGNTFARENVGARERLIIGLKDMLRPSDVQFDNGRSAG
jgi:hypothetical protein